MDFSANILVIDDDESMRIGCEQTLTEEGYLVQSVENGELGLEKIARESFDLILLDLKMPGVSGMDILHQIKDEYPNIVVIIITGYATIGAAVQAMKSGAYDFLTKPFSPETLTKMVKRAIEERNKILKESCVHLAINDSMISENIIGRSEAITRVVKLIKKVAPMDSTVLITGDTGSGKELVARTIHRLSRRSEKPFVTVDCGSLVETLFESEMFGHTKGSFTGAAETTQGKFEQAHGGTLFLDEIANISFNMQSRLLRVIQEQEIFKVGSTQKISINVRIISATNRNLTKEIDEGRFREDLFYRLNVVNINIPPLRERLEDIPALANYFLKKLTKEKKKNISQISDEAMRFLKMQEWPGNVRELNNTIERALVICEGNTIGLGDFSYSGLDNKDNPNLSKKGFLAQVERNEIIKTLKKFKGKKNKAAEYLGINRKTLREKIHKYNIASNF